MKVRGFIPKIISALYAYYAYNFYHYINYYDYLYDYYLHDYRIVIRMKGNAQLYRIILTTTLITLKFLVKT